MFRATQCSSSGESIVSIHHLVYITLCRWPSGMQVRGTLWPAYQTITYTERYIPGDVLMQLILLMMSTGLLETCEGKAVPLQAWSGPEGSRKLRFPDFMTTAQDGGKVVSLTHRLPLPPRNTPGTHFCWRLSLPQGHSATGRIMSLKNSSDTIGNGTRDMPVCSVVP